MAKPLLSVLNGQTAKVPPLWLMRQAGRYLPEYRATRGQAGDFLSLCLNSKLAAEVTLQPVRRFGFDAAILFSDILVIPYALGCKVRFEENVGPVLEPVTSARALKPSNTLAPVYDAVAEVRTALPKDTALIGFCGGPWTVATYLAEGHGSPDQRAAKLWAYRDPEGFSEVIEALVEASVVHLAAQVKAGAEVVQIFDTWAGSLAADGSFARWCLEPTRRLVSAFRAQCPTTPVIGFPRGAGQRVKAYAEATGVQAVGLESGLGLAEARALVGPQIALQGNLDPLALVAGGKALRDAVARIRASATGPHVFNLGHGILPDTPIPHVEELVALVRAP